MGRTACTEPHCVYKGALYLFYFTWPALEAYHGRRLRFAEEKLTETNLLGFNPLNTELNPIYQ